MMLRPGIPKIRSALPYNHDKQSDSRPKISRVKLVYIVSPAGAPGYLALRDTAGRIYSLNKKSPHKAERISPSRIRPLRDNYLLLLLDSNLIENIRQRISQSHKRGLEGLFKRCVRNINTDIKEARFHDLSTIF
ncbi:MAG: hypothetical protein AABX79_02665 [Nanoarchaeota archaeon]